MPGKKVIKKKRTPEKPGKTATFMKGVVSSWSAVDPLAEAHHIEDTNLYHTNPIRQLGMKRVQDKLDVYYSIIHHKFKWRVEVTMEFSDGLETYYVPRVLVFYGHISAGDAAWAEVIEELFEENDMNYYVTTNLRATILDSHPIREQDYKCKEMTA